MLSSVSRRTSARRPDSRARAPARPGLVDEPDHVIARAMHPEDAYPEHDRAVREWFAARDWPVIETFSTFDAEVYAWRHRGRYGEFTLYVTREVLDRNEATAL